MIIIRHGDEKAKDARGGGAPRGGLRMRRICLWAAALFALAWAGALALLLIGAFGLFGAARDPLAGVYLMPLGLPWNRLADIAGAGAAPWLAALAPGVNLALLALLCRVLRRG